MNLREKFHELVDAGGHLSDKLLAWFAHAHATGHSNDLPDAVTGALSLVSEHVHQELARLEQKFKDDIAALHAKFATPATPAAAPVEPPAHEPPAPERLPEAAG